MMHKILLYLVAWFTGICAQAQQMKVEFDKNADLSHYKTFTFGDGQITTPKDMRVVPDATIHQWIRKSLTDELKKKGLVKSDTADLIVSYLTGTDKGTHSGTLGPLGMTPGTTDRTYTNDYLQGSLVIDLNDSKSNALIWRVSATAETNLSESERSIEQIIDRGFNKLSLKARKNKKKP